MLLPFFSSLSFCFFSSFCCSAFEIAIPSLTLRTILPEIPCLVAPIFFDLSAIARLDSLHQRPIISSCRHFQSADLLQLLDLLVPSALPVTYSIRASACSSTPSCTPPVHRPFLSYRRLASLQVIRPSDAGHCNVRKEGITYSTAQPCASRAFLSCSSICSSSTDHRWHCHHLQLGSHRLPRQHHHHT
jgi:hypothetical protein